LTSDDGRFTLAREISLRSNGAIAAPPASGWIDFVVIPNPAQTAGHIEILANDKWIVTVKGRIGHSDKGLGRFQYFKFGPYRATHHNNWTLYYDEFRRSVNRADVLKNAP
jgi:hypothetical protein